jgi:hypothetical protein
MTEGIFEFSAGYGILKKRHGTPPINVEFAYEYL